MSGNAPPDSIGPAGDGKQYVAADWAGGDIDITTDDELGGLSRFIVIPAAATAGTLVVETAKGQTRTFNVDDNWNQMLQIKKIKSTSTVTHVQVFV